MRQDRLGYSQTVFYLMPKRRISSIIAVVSYYAWEELHLVNG